MAGDSSHADDLTFAAGVTLAALRMLLASAQEVVGRLVLDPPEYLADLSCMDRVANLLALRLLQQGHTLTRSGIGPATELCRELREVLDDAFRRAGVSHDCSCINLAAGAVQQHHAAPS